MSAPICPICESHLTGDAQREGRCQCCGSPFPTVQLTVQPKEEAQGDTAEDTPEADSQ
ncbi:MAG: hypothetical protein KF753_02020 [Caldilineaceae bacterium]|nr:hypothetical protein [Caldilineaceae bacterium]